MTILDDIDALIAEHEADQRAYDAMHSRCRSAEPVDTRWRPDRCTCVACIGKTSRDASRPTGAPPPFAWAGRTFQVSDEIISDEGGWWP